MKKLLAVTAIAMSFSSQAALINVTGGDNPTAPGNNMTATNLESLNFSINNATSIYFKNPAVTRPDESKVVPGDLFTDVGMTKVTIPNNSTSSLCNVPLIGNIPCYGAAWELQAAYNFYGAVVNTGVDLAGVILGGFIDLFYVTTPANAATSVSTKVSSIAITGSAGPLTTSVGVNIFGSLDYSGFVNPTNFVKDMFNFSTPVGLGGITSTNWYDLWNAGVQSNPQQFVNSFVVTTLNGSSGNLTKIEDISYGTTTSTIGFNGSPFQNAYFANQPFAALNNTPMVTAARGGEILSGNVTFSVVPEPVSIALFGAGLLGMGLVSRRRREKSVN